MDSKKTYTWHKIAEDVGAIDFAANGMASVELGTKKFCLVRHKESLYACASKCPHAGGQMADGYIDALGNIVCPLHRYKFSLATGRNSSGEGYFLKTYPVEQRAEGVFVGLEKGGLFNW